MTLGCRIVVAHSLPESWAMGQVAGSLIGFPLLDLPYNFLRWTLRPSDMYALL